MMSMTTYQDLTQWNDKLQRLRLHLCSAMFMIYEQNHMNASSSYIKVLL
jgi:hypothetical protein